MPHGHGTLSSAIGEATMMEFPHEQGMLSSATSEVSMEKGKAIPPLGGEATGDGRGLQKTRWFIEPIEDPQHELGLL